MPNASWRRRGGKAQREGYLPSGAKRRTSEAKVCTSEARKTAGNPCAAPGQRPQRGLVSAYVRVQRTRFQGRVAAGTGRRGGSGERTSGRSAGGVILPPKCSFQVRTTIADTNLLPEDRGGRVRAVRVSKPIVGEARFSTKTTIVWKRLDKSGIVYSMVKANNPRPQDKPPTSSGGPRLKEQRVELGLSRVELARLADLSEKTIDRVERGNQAFRDTTYRKIFNALIKARAKEGLSALAYSDLFLANSAVEVR